MTGEGPFIPPANPSAPGPNRTLAEENFAVPQRSNTQASNTCPLKCLREEIGLRRLYTRDSVVHIDLLVKLFLPPIARMAYGAA